MITDLLQENIGEGIPIAALRVSRFCHWGFRCLQASGEVDSGGRAKKLLLVWSSSERGDMVRASYQGRWRGQASSERGEMVCGRQWGREEEEEERRKKSGRRGKKCIKSQFYYYYQDIPSFGV